MIVFETCGHIVEGEVVAPQIDVMDSLAEAYEQTRNANVRLMWPTPLSSAKVLFFFARYYILLHVGLSAMLPKYVAFLLGFESYEEKP
ncbi:hypothetical protein D9611_005294 [Ephemerocybe angulata]|uniref:Uncharacterized protein n=1 Tax=Ephemerocybe angulata TaxID=980116 RepID=A0A8H5C0Y0_9AGAR|nr:hypothetical protein D9611_005294 [Tulosesus angulatus]